MIKQHPHIIVHGHIGNPHLHIPNLTTRIAGGENDSDKNPFLDRLSSPPALFIVNESKGFYIHPQLARFFHKWGIDYMNKLEYKC